MTRVTGRNSPSCPMVIIMDEDEDRQRDLAAEYAMEAFLDGASDKEIRQYRWRQRPRDLTV